MTHIPVLHDEVLAALITDPDGVYLDGTFGRGGHSCSILSKLSPQGRLIAFDRDPTAIACARDIDDPRFSIHHACFSEMADMTVQLGLAGKVTGILLDLGVSSPQLDEAERGFSFRYDGPLDMRMDPTHGEPVSAWLAHADEQDIANVIYRYGEERRSRQIARAIVQQRAKQQITRTSQLADIVANVVYSKDKHPATRTFQALRIFINGELDELTGWLDQFDGLLCTVGRAVVMSFHSLEDRLVKQYFTQLVKGPEVPRHVPLTQEQLAQSQRYRWVMKQQKPSAQEQQENPRSRSVVMRAVEKI